MHTIRGIYIIGVASIFSVVNTSFVPSPTRTSINNRCTSKTSSLISSSSSSSLCKWALQSQNRESAVVTKNPTTAIRIDQERLSQQLQKCKTGTAARDVLESTLTDECLYNAVRIPVGASDKYVSDVDLAIATKIRNSKYSIMELIDLNGNKDIDRASFSLICVTVASVALSTLVQQYSFVGEPPILQFLVALLLSFAPLIFVGLGLAVPAELQTYLVQLQRSIFPTYRKRILQHEAGHFLIGHLLGLPIKGYSTNAIKNAVEFYPLSDDDVGKQRASQLGFDANRSSSSNTQSSTYNEKQEQSPYYSQDGRGGSTLLQQSVFREEKNYRDNPFLKLPSRDDPEKAWPYRGFDHATLDKLCAISVAGVCAEILAFGAAEGGYADFSQLRQLFNSADPELSPDEMENKIRYALGFVMGQLRRNLGALDSLADVMEEGEDISQCVVAIETCDNKSGATVLGNYEELRRTQFQKEDIGFLERLLLSGGKNMDTPDNDTIEGEGGGNKVQAFELTGDDPLYAAIAVTAIFLLYSLSGGITLH